MIEKVKEFLAAEGIEVLEFDVPTPTSETAALAVGCAVGAIAKSVLVLVGGVPVVVIASGDTKISSSRLKQALGLSGKVRFADAEQVLALTGYRPGGVCPFLLPDGVGVLLDSSLSRFDSVYPAAGNAYSAVPLGFDLLKSLSGATVVDVCLPLDH